MRHIAIALFALVGCIDEFHGSNVQFDFSPAMPAQASPYRAPFMGELPSNIHFTLYAFSRVDDNGMVTGYLFELQRFEVHHIVDLSSPCFIDVGEHVPFPGLHVTQFADKVKQATGITDVANPPPTATEEQMIDVATAITRQDNVAKLGADTGPRVITSATTAIYTGIGADCNDATGIPPPTCTTDAENVRRLEKCQTAWRADDQHYEGTDRVLTQPLNGINYGFVDGDNPINMAPLGGASFFVNEQLDDFEAFAIYWQYDDADHDGQPDYPATVPANERTQLGVQFLYGRPQTPTRGVIHVHMISLVSPATAEVAIFANIDEDDVHF